MKLENENINEPQNPAFWVGAVIASGICPPSLQTIVIIEFLCH